MNLRFAALVPLLLVPLLVCAQLPPRLERCLPYPTLAQEINAMWAETHPQLPEPEPPPSPRVVIVSVQFASGTHIPRFLRDRIVSSIESRRFYDDPEMDWLVEIQDVGIRGALQDSGYFKASVKADSRLIDANQHRRRFALILYLDEGQRYRLADVRFQRADPDDKRPLAFATSELRSLVALRRGEFFNVSKIRAALEAVTRLYHSRGYIDMVTEPKTSVEDDPGILDLLMKIDEGKQYRLAKLEFLGLDEKTQRQLRPQLKPGDLFDGNFVEELLKRNKSLLPADASWKDVQMRRNTAEGLVDLRFDFYSCSKLYE